MMKSPFKKARHYAAGSEVLQAAPSEGGIYGDVKVKPKEPRDHRRKEVSGTWTTYESALKRWSCVTTPSKVVVSRAAQPLPQPGQSAKLTLKDSTFALLHFGFVCSSLSFVFSCSSLLERKCLLCVIASWSTRLVFWFLQGLTAERLPWVSAETLDLVLWAMLEPLRLWGFLEME